MKSKKGEDNQVYEIILAAIGILILVGLAAKLYNITKNTEIEKAVATLDEINLNVDNLAKLENENVKKEALVLNPEGWSLRSIEFGKGFCSSSFCLCLCKDSSCSGQLVCKPSNNFILLRDEKGIEKRTLEQETPFGAELSYIKGDFYPFNKKMNNPMEAPLFYRFNSAYTPNARWEWSSDLKNWVGLENYATSASAENALFIREFSLFINNLDKTQNPNYEEKGKEFLKNKGIEESKGVVAFQVKKNG